MRSKLLFFFRVASKFIRKTFFSKWQMVLRIVGSALCKEHADTFIRTSRKFVCRQKCRRNKIWKYNGRYVWMSNGLVAFDAPPAITSNTASAGRVVLASVCRKPSFLRLNCLCIYSENAKNAAHIHTGRTGRRSSLLETWIRNDSMHSANTTNTFALMNTEVRRNCAMRKNEEKFIVQYLHLVENAEHTISNDRACNSAKHRR